MKVGEMTIIFSDNMLQDIVEYEAMNQIRTIHGNKESSCTILNYASVDMRERVKKERDGEKIFDWDALTYKDENGDLIELLCDRIDSLDNITKRDISEKIINKLMENIIKYYKNEFDEKVEEAKDYYDQFGNFDLLEA
jgi:hypothetical protein